MKRSLMTNTQCIKFTVSDRTVSRMWSLVNYNPTLKIHKRALEITQEGALKKFFFLNDCWFEQGVGDNSDTWENTAGTNWQAKE